MDAQSNVDWTHKQIPLDSKFHETIRMQETTAILVKLIWLSYKKDNEFSVANEMTNEMISEN